MPLEDIYFDPLVLSLSTDQKNALVFLETLRAIKRELPGAKTVSGLSNISFGLPKRKVLNQAFLVLAVGAGMDAAIADPTDKALMAMVTARKPWAIRILTAPAICRPSGRGGWTIRAARLKGQGCRVEELESTARGTGI